MRLNTHLHLLAHYASKMTWENPKRSDREIFYDRRYYPPRHSSLGNEFEKKKTQRTPEFKPAFINLIGLPLI